MESHRKRPSLLLRAPPVTAFLNSLQRASLLKGPGQAWTRSEQGKSQIRGRQIFRSQAESMGRREPENSHPPLLCQRGCGQLRGVHSLSSSLTSCVNQAAEVWTSERSGQVPRSVSSTYHQGWPSCQRVSMSSEPRHHSLKMEIHRG